REKPNLNSISRDVSVILDSASVPVLPLSRRLLAIIPVGFSLMPLQQLSQMPDVPGRQPQVRSQVASGSALTFLGSTAPSKAPNHGDARPPLFEAGFSAFWFNRCSPDFRGVLDWARGTPPRTCQSGSELPEPSETPAPLQFARIGLLLGLLGPAGGSGLIRGLSNSTELSKRTPDDGQHHIQKILLFSAHKPILRTPPIDPRSRSRPTTRRSRPTEFVDLTGGRRADRSGKKCQTAEDYASWTSASSTRWGCSFITTAEGKKVHVSELVSSIELGDGNPPLAKSPGRPTRRRSPDCNNVYPHAGLVHADTDARELCVSGGGGGGGTPKKTRRLTTATGTSAGTWSSAGA
uniref:Uncharacterized protein n=1 Tax=Macrostomum lignano TaxID=282301 RepID=A0A1I8FR55_9PLAT